MRITVHVFTSSLIAACDGIPGLCLKYSAAGPKPHPRKREGGEEPRPLRSHGRHLIEHAASPIIARLSFRSLCVTDKTGVERLSDFGTLPDGTAVPRYAL